MRIVIYREKNFFYLKDGKEISVEELSNSRWNFLKLISLEKLTYNELIKILLDLIDEIDPGECCSEVTIDVSLAGNDSKSASARVSTYVDSNLDRVTEINLLVGPADMCHDFATDESIRKIYAKKCGDCIVDTRYKKFYPKELKGMRELNEDI